MRDYLRICGPLTAKERHPDPTSGFVLQQLALSCHATGESALILIGSVRLWDAEMLIRSVFEGTFKFAYLCGGTAADRSARANEYWEVLPAITRLKRHQRAQQLLAALDKPDADEWRPIRELMLDPSEVAALQAKYPKTHRQQVEHKWSFFEIAHMLDKENGTAGALRHLMYGYGMASHQIHQDGDAIGMIWDREQREPERRDAVELAHGCRMLSDLLVMSMLRAVSLSRAVGVDLGSVKDADRAHEAFRSELHAAQSEWHRVEYAPGVEEFGRDSGSAD
jgi:hypothetical protein